MRLALAFKSGFAGAKRFSLTAPPEFGVIADFVFQIDANTEILKVRIPPLGGIHAKGQYESEILIDRFLPTSHPQGS
jgi:hypothetical protein